MMIFREFKAVYLGLKRWKVTAPGGFIFDVIAYDGIEEIKSNIIRWRKIWGLPN